MIMTFTLDGTITSVNRGLEVALGWSREELIGQHYGKLATPAALACANEHTQRALAGEAVSSIFTAEILSKEGTRVPIEVRARFIRTPAGKPIGIQSIFRDLSERQRLERTVKTSEAKYRTIFAASPDFIYLTDSGGKLLDANPALLDWQGLSLAELQQRHFLDFLASDNREEVMRAFAALQQEQTVRGLEVRAHNKQGEIREFEVNAAPLPKPGGDLEILSIARDLTERRRAEAALATLSRQLLEAQESERHRLAYELHDELGQGLTTLKLMLQMLKGIPEAGAQQLRDSIQLVDDLILRARTLSLDLRPLMLDELGLVATLHWYVYRQEQRVGFVAHFATDALKPRPHPAVETACFRVVQEALTNVARHAQARHVWVEVRQHDSNLSLCIRDDGVGFDVPTTVKRARQGASFGVLGMEERLRLVGGHLEIHSTPGNGTTISAHVPLHPPTLPSHREVAGTPIPPLRARKGPGGKR